MCTVRFIGCLHFGHEWMARHRNFINSEQHDQDLIHNWNKIVGKKDLTFILGDVTMENDEYYHLLDDLNGRKIVVLGNHDLPKHTRTLLKHVETVAGMIDYKGFCLTHAPIHPSEISFYRGNIHAHIHENKLAEVWIDERYGETGVTGPSLQKYYCVDAHLIDYKPKSIEELLN